MRNIDEIEKDLEACRGELHKLLVERKEYRLSKINSLKYISHRIYKFQFPIFEDKWADGEFVGIIKDIWFSEESRCYYVEFCGLINNLCHDSQEFADCQWGSFDGDIQREVREDQIKRFIDNLQELSLEEFWKYYDNVFLDNMKERTKYWVEYYLNNSEEQ